MSARLPHEGVFVRLGVSKTHGIGVLAGCSIAAGTNVFGNDDREICWVLADILRDPYLDQFQRSFYQDFALRPGDKLGCPSNFNLLTVGWYLNKPLAHEEPNLKTSQVFDLVTVQDIAAGEELTVLYSSFDTVER